MSDASDQTPVDFKRAGRHKVDLVDQTKVDRQPPHSIESEQGVLGCILLSPRECMPSLVEKLVMGSHVFYDLRNRLIYETMLWLYERNRMADNVVVLQTLRDFERLDAAGGVAYLAGLPDAVPSAANLDYYVDIVLEKWTRRQAIGVCQNGIKMAYESTGEVKQYLDTLEHDILEIGQQAEGFTKPTTKGARALVLSAIDTMERLHQNQGAIPGIATGFFDFDRMTLGLHNGEMAIVAARPSAGKAQPLSAMVLTPTGFVQMGSLSVGSIVVGANGEPTPIVSLVDHPNKEVVCVTLSDGTTTECCTEHLWFTQTRNERRRGIAGSVKSAESIALSLTRQDSDSPNHALPLHGPVLPSNRDVDLPLHPWLLGALLGDGSLHSGNILFCKPENDVQQKLISLLPVTDTGVVCDGGRTVRIKRAAKNNEKSHTSVVLSQLGLRVYSQERFIPSIYLDGSVNQRLLLLQGLLDTDGSVLKNGSSVEYSTTSIALRETVACLSRSLGFITTVSPARLTQFQNGFGRPSWRINVHIRKDSLLPVTSTKHLARLKLTERKFHRSIVSIQSVGDKPCRCIQVAAADGLYLTDDYIVTHNSSLAMNIVDHVGVTLRLPVAVFSLEMTAESLMLRMVCARARVNLRHVSSGTLAQNDFTRLTSVGAQLAAAPIHVDDARGLTILQLKAKARRLQQQHGIRLFVVDYLQLLKSSNHRASNREQEVSDISSGLHNMAGELNVPVLVLAQLNRNVENRGPGAQPRLSDLRESGSLEQDADLVGLLYKRDQFEDERDSHAEAIAVNLLVAKQRNGPTGEIPLMFMKAYTRFESVTQQETVSI